MTTIFTADQIAKISISSRETNTVSESRSGVRYVRNNMTQRFAANVTFAALPNTQARALYAQLVALQGQQGTAQVQLPFTEQHNITGTMQANGTYVAGTSIITLTGGYTGTLDIGGLINFSGHPKAYMVTNHSGNTLTISPPLRKAINSDAVIHQAPYILAYMDNDEPEWQPARSTSQIKAKFVEELN